MALGEEFIISNILLQANISTAAAAAAGGIAAAAYLDGKYQLRRELGYIRKLKTAEREYNRRRMSAHVLK